MVTGKKKNDMSGVPICEPMILLPKQFVKLL